MIDNELYHYGVPGMRWGSRRGKQTYNSASKSRSKKKPTEDSKTKIQSKPKSKMSTGKKVAIGTAAAGVALTGIGAMVVTSKKFQNYSLARITSNALLENM